jgi:hypothetical protein
MEHSADDRIAVFKELFHQITAIPRQEWDLIDVYALSDELLGMAVEQGPHQFGRRFRVSSLNRGFRPDQDPRKLVMILILGEILEPHTLESHPSPLIAEGQHPRAIWGGELPTHDDGALAS